MQTGATHPIVLTMRCLALTIVLTTSNLVSASPLSRNQLFTTCWGWGASCTMHSAVNRAFPPMVSGHSQRPEPSVGRNPAGIPSMVTSGTWEPGTMGKRFGTLTHRQQDLIALLEKAVRETYAQA
ncbi:unnamed protein product [Candidula unifasciata]|uniref:Uncharacterized protein n=1 Tax=Candidula unifasciata TaxID=100452 RepID=A0A8S3YKM4_9EUPU|nr:unnamed protein product [Candidula unifasciata]